MFHIFSLLQSGVVFENINPFSYIFKAISREKSCLISFPFLPCLLRTVKFFPPAETWSVTLNFPRVSRMHGRDRVWTPILFPRARTPFDQHQESQPLGRSSEIPVLNGFANTIERDRNQSDLSDFTLSMHRVTGSSSIADFRCWTRSEVVILGADQKERDHCITSPKCCNSLWIYLKRKRDLYVTSQDNFTKVTFPRRLGNSSSGEKTPWNPGLPDV